MKDNTIQLTCPHCGQKITLAIVEDGLGAGAHTLFSDPHAASRVAPGMHRYRFGGLDADDDPEPDYTHPLRQVFETPARAASVESDVKVPLLNATIAGLLTTAVSLTLTLGFEGFPLWLAPILGLLAMTLVWIVRQNDSVRLLRRREEYEYPQPQQQEAPAVPPAPNDILYVVAPEPGADVRKDADGHYWAKNPDGGRNSEVRIEPVEIPYKHSLRAIAQAILMPPDGAGMPFTGRKLSNVTGLSRAQIVELQNALIENGFLKWRGMSKDNPAGSPKHPLGPQLTRTGLELFYSQLPPTMHRGR